MNVFTLDAFSVFLQVIFVDLILAADNAIIVAMVASRVSEQLRQRVILLGIGAAVVMRILFSLLTVQLMSLPGLKLCGGLLLLLICWKLYQQIRGESGDAERQNGSENEQLDSLRLAIVQIVIADLSMSIDNVIAIAGVSRDYPTILVMGLVLSVAFMIFAATLIARLVKRYPWINYVGLVIIFYVALQMIYEDLGAVKHLLLLFGT